MIECADLEKRFPDRLALDGVSLRVEAGECVALLGGNGAGKTTLLRTIAGRLLADGGSVRIDGIDPARDPRSLAGVVGCVLSSANAWDLRLSAADNLEFFGVAQGMRAAEARAAAEERLAGAALEAHARRAVGTFSQGMRARLAFARALLRDPAVLLLDEPTAGLDAASTDLLLHELGRDRGRRTVLLATHSLPEAAAVADRAVALEAGRIRAQIIVPKGSPEALAAALDASASCS